MQPSPFAITQLKFPLNLNRVRVERNSKNYSVQTMFSILNPSFVYRDISPDVTEHDIDVVSDLWNINGHEVYRGSRDGRYTHANVYWLYDEGLSRVGCSEHEKQDHANFQVLWFDESPFTTLLQEKWTTENELWNYLPKHVVELFLSKGWTTPNLFLEQCLQDELRIITPSMITDGLPTLYSCPLCGTKKLRPSGCAKNPEALTIPNKEKVFFVDNDLVVYIPPVNSSVWVKLGLACDDDSSGQMQGQERPGPVPLPASPLPPPPSSLPVASPSQPQPQEPLRPLHPQTPELQSDVGEVKLEHTRPSK